MSQNELYQTQRYQSSIHDNPGGADITIPITGPMLGGNIWTRELTESLNAPGGEVPCFIRENIPVELAEKDCWVGFRLDWNEDAGKYTGKEPINPATGYRAKCNNSSTWGTLDQALEGLANGLYNAIGYALPVERPSGPGLVFIDVDKCITNDEIDPAVAELISAFEGTYIERSASRNGIHILARGEIDSKSNVTVVTDKGEVDVEIYKAVRFMVITGDLLEQGVPGIEDKQDALDWLASQIREVSARVVARHPRGPVRLPETREVPEDLERVGSALAHLDSDTYDEWFRTGIALKRYGVDVEREEECWQLFDEWSRRTDNGNYFPEANRKQWDSWDTESHPHPQRITIASIFDLAKRKGWDERALTSAKNGAKGGRPANPPHYETATRVFNMLRDSESDTPMLLKTPRGWHSFEGREGWKTIPHDQAKGIITGIMQDDHELKNLTSSTYIRSVIDNLCSPNFCFRAVDYGNWILEDETMPGPDLMSFGDGLILNMRKLCEIPVEAWEGLYGQELFDQIKGAVFPSSAAFFSKSYVPYPLIPKGPPELFMRYLDRVMPDADGQRMLAELAGIVLSDETGLEKMWFLVGTGQNGKGMFARVLTGLVGEDCVCNVKMDQLSRDSKFTEWPLAEHKLNIDADVGKAQRREMERLESLLKTVVSGEGKQVERKGVDAHKRTFTARLVFLTNLLPEFVDTSNAIYRRFVLIPFNETIGEDERNLNLKNEIIEPELLSGIFWWAMKGLVSVKKEGFFVSKESQKAKDDHFARCCPERGFFNAWCVKDPDGFVPKIALQTRYHEWCDENDVAGDTTRLVKYLEQDKGLEITQRRMDGRRIRGYMGIRLVDPKEVTIRSSSPEPSS